MSTVIALNRRRQKGHQQILEQLFREHGEALRSFLLGRVRNKADIEDIIQDVFSRLARQKDLNARHHMEARQNRAYIFTMANNLIVDMERRKAVRSQYCVENQQNPAGKVYELSPDVVVVAQEQLSTVKEAIKGLKPTWRTAFVLSRFKHMSYKEISAVMGVTERQVEAFVARAVVKLKASLEPFGSEPGNQEKVR